MELFSIGLIYDGMLGPLLVKESFFSLFHLFQSELVFLGLLRENFQYKIILYNLTMSLSVWTTCFLSNSANIIDTHTSLLYISFLLKFRMEMVNVSKRKQPDHRADNNSMPSMGLQCCEKLPHPEASFSWPPNKYVY